MSTPTVYILIVTHFICLTLSSYLNETIIVDLDLTIASESILIITENEMQTIIEKALISANEEKSIYDIDNIQFISNYNYYNEDNNDYEYTCILYMYFQTENDYINAVNNGYSKYIYSSLNTYISNFENKIRTELFNSINEPNSFSIQKILINEMKIIKLEIDDNMGKLLINYNGDVTTTNAPTQLTLNPTISPTPSPSITTITENNDDNNEEPILIETSNYTFSNEGTYWILLILFLFIGCYIGCCCWYFICIRMGLNIIIKQRIEDIIIRKNIKDIGSNSDNNNNNKQTDISIEMGNKKKKKKRIKKYEHSSSSDDDSKNKEKEEKEGDNEQYTQEEIKRKRQRYIDYGSEDDSGQEEAYKMPKKKPRKRPSTNDTQTRREISDDESIEKIINTNDNNNTTRGGSDSSETSRRKRRKNKKTGTIEKERYDEDGKRQLTTKELMLQYKKNRQKGGDSIDLSYKVGKKKRKKHQNINMEQKEGDNEMNESEGDEYEFDDINHPHYKAPAKLNKINEKYSMNKRNKKIKGYGHELERRNTGDLNRRRDDKKGGKHKRSNTATLTQRSKTMRNRSQGGKDKIHNRKGKKYKRPHSARNVNMLNKKYKRPQSAKNSNNNRKRKKRNIVKRDLKKRYKDDSDSESDEDESENEMDFDDEESVDNGSHTPQPNDVNRDDDDDESSEY